MDPLPETPCYACGVRAGGRLRDHKSGCEYVTSLCVRWPEITTFLRSHGEEWKRTEPRKNVKH
jgi:hypothetical protein